MNSIVKYFSNLISSKTNLAIVVFMAAAGYFLFTEHKAHLFGAAPYLLLLACVGMHLFMHGGHGNHGQHSHKVSTNDDQEKEL